MVFLHRDLTLLEVLRLPDQALLTLCYDPVPAPGSQCGKPTPMISRYPQNLHSIVGVTASPVGKAQKTSIIRFQLLACPQLLHYSLLLLYG